MKESKGKANPKITNQLVAQKLKNKLLGNYQLQHNYKIIPTPIFKNKLLNKKSINIQIAELIENIMNEESRQGWDFVDIKTIMVPVKKSFFNSSSEKKVSILLFKRRTTENSSFESTSQKMKIILVWDLLQKTN